MLYMGNFLVSRQRDREKLAITLFYNTTAEGVGVGWVLDMKGNKYFIIDVML